MKKFFAAALAAFTVITAGAQKYDELGAKLEQYFTALAGESASVQNQECDFLIESAADSLVRQYVALKIYDHYLNSKIMGDEAMAVHVVDKWFSTGKVKMASEEDLRNAKLFAEFNRSSLIGSQAPSIGLKNPSGKKVSIPVSGRYNVLYFYDGSCASCKVESARLTAFINEGAYPDIKYYAIYTGADADGWKNARTALGSGFTHLWDPSMDSDWQRKYGVLGTPKMFLVNPDGAIIGRGLDTPALGILLSREFSDGKYTYGDESQTGRYAQMFSSFGDSLSVNRILEVADYLAARTFGEGNIDSFKQVEGDLLYYLSQQHTEVYKDAVKPFVQRYISIPDVWESEEDKAQVVSLGEFLSEMTSRTPAGSEVPDLTVTGTLRRKPFPIFVKGSKEGSYQLRKLKGNPSYIVFYSQGCSECQALLSRVDEVVNSSRKVKVLLVDMDAALASGEGQTLLDTFDLTYIPMVIQLDKKGIIQHRYVQL